MVYICGTYVEEQYRNSSVAQELINFTMKKLLDECLKYLGVDCETLNSTAIRFWAKYFESYTYSLIGELMKEL